MGAVPQNTGRSARVCHLQLVFLRPRVGRRIRALDQVGANRKFIARAGSGDRSEAVNR